MQSLPKHHVSRTPQNKKSRDATMWRLYNDVGIENSLLSACELQIRKNGFYFIPALQIPIFTASELQIWKNGVADMQKFGAEI